jgi:hypothetical protein
MKGSRKLIAAAATLGLLLAAPAAQAAETPDPIQLDPGVASPGFGLLITFAGEGNQLYKEFVDQAGNPVRILSAGQGWRLTFTNTTTGESITLRPSGSVSDITINPDGSQSWVNRGQNVLILFPTDVPAGPTTTLYYGRITFTVDAQGVYTLGSTSGPAIDLCAALA